MNRFLVLGSDGFIGSATCRVIDSSQDEAVAIRHVRFPTGSPRLDLEVSDVVEHPLDLSHASLADVSLLLAQTEPTVVVNCIGATVGDAATMLDANVRTVATLLSALADHPEVRLVQIGSAAEYGQSVPDRSVRETDLPAPLNDYGRTKLTATRLVLGAVAQGRVHGTVLRVFNPIGRGASDRTLLGCAVGRIAAAMAAHDDRVHLGSLSSSRDFIDVGDVASAIVAAGSSPYASGALLNVARGEAVQSRTLVDALVAISGFRGKVIEDAGGSARSDHLAWQQADISAIRLRLGWTPKRSLADAVTEMWSYRRAPCTG